MEKKQTVQIQENGTYVLIARKPWNKQIFRLIESQLPGTWRSAESFDIDEEDVDLYFYADCDEKLPPSLVAQGNRIGFHTGPFRGGSPVQHAILAGVDQGILYCYQMGEGLDDGNIVAAIPVPLLGGAEEVYNRLAYGIYLILDSCTKGDGMVITDQKIEGEFRTRRTPEQSEISDMTNNLQQLHDFIRMLDAPTYPPAFIRYGDLKLHFTRPCYRTGCVQADVTITYGGQQ